MIIKTKDLAGVALDWAVAKCEEVQTSLSKTGYLIYLDPKVATGPMGRGFSPSINWVQGGIIMEREGISTVETLHGWQAWRRSNTNLSYGATVLVSAMRCYVASKLGNEIDIPEELTK